MESFYPIGILLVVGLILCGAIHAITVWLGPKRPTPSKLQPYECGVPLEGTARQPFRARFYLIAVLFLLFDVEAVFFFPWALVYRDSLRQGAGLLIALIAYMFFMALGLIYIYRKNCLEIS